MASSNSSHHLQPSKLDNQALAPTFGDFLQPPSCPATQIKPRSKTQKPDDAVRASAGSSSFLELKLHLQQQSQGIVVVSLRSGKKKKEEAYLKVSEVTR